jgi:predicted dehydrogenase
VSEKYLPDLYDSPHANVVAVCDVDEGLARKAADKYTVSACYTDVDEMLTRTDFDLYINLTPTQLHGRYNLKGLQAGRHVLSEKPMATNLEEANMLMEEADRRNLKIWAAPNAVISPTFRAAAEVVNSGAIGKVCSARGRYGHGGPLHSAWFYKAGAGSMYDLGVYNVCTITGLLGPVEGVVALSGVAVPDRVVGGVPIKVEAEDNTILLLDFGESVYGVIQTGFTYPAYDDRFTIELMGTGGALNWLGYDWAPQGIEVYTLGSGEEWMEDRPWQTHAEDQAGYTWQCGGSYLARCLAEDEEALMTPEHAYHCLEVMLAGSESAENGRRVEIQSTFPWPIVTDGLPG